MYKLVEQQSKQEFILFKVNRKEEKKLTNQRCNSNWSASNESLASVHTFAITGDSPEKDSPKLNVRKLSRGNGTPCFNYRYQKQEPIFIDKPYFKTIDGSGSENDRPSPPPTNGSCCDLNVSSLEFPNFENLPSINSAQIQTSSTEESQDTEGNCYKITLMSDTPRANISYEEIHINIQDQWNNSSYTCNQNQFLLTSISDLKKEIDQDKSLFNISRKLRKINAALTLQRWWKKSARIKKINQFMIEQESIHSKAGGTCGIKCCTQ